MADCSHVSIKGMINIAIGILQIIRPIPTHSFPEYFSLLCTYCLKGPKRSGLLQGSSPTVRFPFSVCLHNSDLIL